MSLTIDQLEQEAMQLPPPSRARLAEKLVESLDVSQLDEIQKRWVAEAVRRRDEVRSGRVKPIAGEQFWTKHAVRSVDDVRVPPGGAPRIS